MAKKPITNNSELMHGICMLNVIPVINKPSDTGEMISQLLFGETFQIIFRKSKFWIKIQATHCSASGWVKTNQILLTDEKTYNNLITPSAKSLEICHPVFNGDNAKNIVIGSRLPLFDGISLIMPDGKYIFNGQATTSEGLETDAELIVKIAKRFLHTPELPGGRTPFGIDSGALIQHIYSFFNIFLPRTPLEQCRYGENIDFMEFVQEGDIAFCENNDNIISHAGIIMNDQTILHVYGSVRIDKIDHFGIFNTDIRRYTHRLRIVKRHSSSNHTFKLNKRAYS